MLLMQLVGNGDVELHLEGSAEVPCPHGKVHRREVSESVTVGWQMCRHDMAMVEEALRGDAGQAERLALDLIGDLAKRVWLDPCNEVTEGV